MAGLHDIKLGRVARSDWLWDGGRSRSSAMASYLYLFLCGARYAGLLLLSGEYSAVALVSERLFLRMKALRSGKR